MRLSALALSVALLCSCAAGRQDVALFAPELLSSYDQLVQREDQLKQELPELEAAAEAAVESPDPSDDLPAAEALALANAELAAIEAQVAPIEERVLRAKAQPVADVASSIHPALGALLMAAVPLAGKRGRKLYGSMLRSAARGKLLVAAGDILKILGAQHSSPQPPPAPENPA